MRSFVACAIALAAAIAAGGVARADQMTAKAETLIMQAVSEQRARLAPSAPAFALDPVLVQIARDRAQAMALGRAPLGHTDAKGNYPAYDAIRARFAPFDGALGENIGVGGGSDVADPGAFAADAIQHWMASPGHRGNILSPGFNRIGVGVATNNSMAIAVLVFTGPSVH